MSDLYRVSLPATRKHSAACFGILVDGGRVAGGAPLGRWMSGRRIAAVADWVRRAGGTIERCQPGRTSS